MGTQFTLKPERVTELEEYAKAHGQSLSEALDDLLAVSLERERADHEETIAALLEADEDVRAGRTKPAEEVFNAMRLKHGL
jgi:hypothetical protein